MIHVGDLTFENEEEAEAYFDETLFEIKKDLLQKPLLRATLKSRLRKLDQLEELEKVLGEVGTTHELSLPETPFFTEFSVQEQWRIFASGVSKWKLAISSVNSVSALRAIVENGFALWKAYCLVLPEIVLYEEDPKVGLAENVMVLNDGFRLMEEQSIRTFQELLIVQFEDSEQKERLHLFLVELKRLSLRIPYL